MPAIKLPSQRQSQHTDEATIGEVGAATPTSTYELTSQTNARNSNPDASNLSRQRGTRRPRKAVTTSESYSTDLRANAVATPGTRSFRTFTKSLPPDEASTAEQNLTTPAVASPASSLSYPRITARSPSSTDIPLAAQIVVWSVVAVLFVIAAILWFSNFPVKIPNLVKRLRSRARDVQDYVAIEQKERRGSDWDFTVQHRDSSAVATPVLPDHPPPQNNNTNIESRRRKGRVDMYLPGRQPEILGLGIELSEARRGAQTISDRRGTGFKSVDIQPYNSMRKSGHTHLHPTTASAIDDHHFLHDLESGTSSAVSSPMYIGVPLSARERKPLHRSSGLGDLSIAGQRVHGMFGRVNDGVEAAMGKLAKVLQDQVREDPEEGLLLPVGACEREASGKLKGAKVQ